MTHPSIYPRLQAEVDRFYPSGENALDPKHYHEMPYLEAVMYVHFFWYQLKPSD